jgi:hypothetical protein
MSREGGGLMPSQVFAARGTKDALRASLDELARQDKIIEAKIKQANLYVTIAAIPAALVFFAIFVGLSPVVFIIFLVPLIPAIVYRVTLGRQDLEDRRIEAGREFFHVLGQDIPSQTQCAVDIDFQGYRKHGTLTDKKAEGFLGSTRQFSYSDSWFAASGKLHDGNSFKVEIEQSIKRKEKSKRKYTKVNEAIRETVKLSLRIDPATYPRYNGLPSFLASGVSTGDMRIAKADLVDSTLRLSAITPLYRITSGRTGKSETGKENLVSSKKLIALFLYVYRQLQRCR